MAPQALIAQPLAGAGVNRLVSANEPEVRGSAVSMSLRRLVNGLLNKPLNPAGIPYLYLASLEKTAIAEVRPHPGQNVVTAKFQVKSPESPGLKIANLIKFTPQVSPIEILDTDEILRIRTLYVALKEISLDFSRPVRPDATPYEYIPTQYLCEIIKGEGFDGVAYPSAISDGHNIVLFDPPSFSALEGSLTEYRIKSVFVDIEEFKST